MENQKFVQKRENLPAVLKSSRRFFPVAYSYNAEKRKYDKTPLISDYYNPANLKLLEETSGIVGCVVTDFLFLDFDNIFNDFGEFLNENVADYVNFLTLTFPDIYIEKSISDKGLHAFLIPTDGAFQTITNNQYGVLHFDEKNTSKLELFYKTNGRWCLLTGEKYEDSNGDLIPEGVAVDHFLSGVLADIKKQFPDVQDSNKTFLFQENNSDYSDPPEYFRDLAIFLLKKLDCKEISKNDSEWLSVISSCKNCGVPDNITPTVKIPINFEMFQAYTKFLKNIFGFIVDGVIPTRPNFFRLACFKGLSRFFFIISTFEIISSISLSVIIIN